MTDLELQLQDAVGAVLTAWHRDGRPLGQEAAVVLIHPHDRDGKPVIHVEGGTAAEVRSSLTELRDRLPGPQIMIAGGELFLEP